VIEALAGALTGIEVRPMNTLLPDDPAAERYALLCASVGGEPPVALQQAAPARLCAWTTSEDMEVLTYLIRHRAGQWSSGICGCRLRSRPKRARNEHTTRQPGRELHKHSDAAVPVAAGRGCRGVGDCGGEGAVHADFGMTARDTQESHWRWVRTTVHIEGVLSAPDIVMAVIGLLEDSGAQVDEGWRRQRRLTAAFKAADELRLSWSLLRTSRLMWTTRRPRWSVSARVGGEAPTRQREH
jgi:hypothetical protein